MTNTESASPSRKRTVLILSSLMYFIEGVLLFALAPMAGLLMQDLNLTYTQAGIILAAPFITHIFGAAFAGTFADRFGSFRTIGFASIMMTAASGLRGLSGNFEQLFFLSILFSAGYISVTITVPKVIAEWFPSNERGVANGVANAAFSAGSFLSLAVTRSVVEPLIGSWQRTLEFYMVPAAAVVVMWWLLRVGAPTEVRSNSTTITLFTGLKKAVRNKAVWIIFSGFFCVLGAQIGIVSWLPRILELRGLSSAITGPAAGALYIGGIIGNLTIPKLSDRMGRRKPFLLVLTPVFALAVYGMGTGADLVLWLAGLAAGAASSTLFSMFLTVLSEQPGVTSSEYGASVGLALTGYGLGSFLQPSLAGYLRDASGSFYPAVVMFALLPVVSALLLTRLKESA